MKCEFCASQLPAGVDKCPNCGATVSLNNVIPPPSPYYEETVGPDPVIPIPEAATPQVVVISTPRPTQTITLDPAIREMFTGKTLLALLSLIFGIVGIFTVTFGICGMIVNLPGLIFGVMGLQSPRRKMAVAGVVLNIIGMIIGVVLTVLFFTLIYTGNRLSQ